VSPDGASWIALYKSVVGQESTADHMKNIAFDHHVLAWWTNLDRGLRLQRQPHLLSQGDARGWRGLESVAMEYPIELKARLDPLVISIAQAIDNTQADCGATAAKIQ
jgi:hypothetical protein